MKEQNTAICHLRIGIIHRNWIFVFITSRGYTKLWWVLKALFNVSQMQVLPHSWDSYPSSRRASSDAHLFVLDRSTVNKSKEAIDTDSSAFITRSKKGQIHFEISNPAPLNSSQRCKRRSKVHDWGMGGWKGRCFPVGNQAYCKNESRRSLAMNIFVSASSWACIKIERAWLRKRMGAEIYTGIRGLSLFVFRWTADAVDRDLQTE